MNQEQKELISEVMAYLRENSVVVAPIGHDGANSNFAIISAIVSAMLRGNSELEIMNDLTSSYTAETAKRFVDSARLQYEKIKRNSPEEFSEYLIANAKNITPQKKKLPKPRKELPNKENPSTHVNADGSIIEMSDVLKKEELQ